MEEYIGTKAAADILKKSQQTISRMCRDKKIASAEQDKEGSPWRMLRTEIEQMKSEGRKK